MRRMLFLIFIALAVCGLGPSAKAQTTPAVPAPSAEMDARVRGEVAAFKGKVYLYAKNLDTGVVYSLAGDERVRTASTIKLAVMVEAFSRVAEGKAKWADEVVLTKSVRYGGSGVLNDLDDGLRLRLRDAVTLMITVSDNTATNLAIEYLTADAVNERMASLGFKDTRLMRRVGGGGESKEGKIEENKRFGLGRSSPREMVMLLEKLERGEIAGAAASKEMIELLKREKYSNGLFRWNWKLTVANKTGALDLLRSDVGLIYTPRGRIAVAVTCDDMPEPDWTDDNPALLLMSRLSKILVDGLGK
jgi:beta-lactamase class A